MKLPTVEAAVALMLEAVRPLPPEDTPLAQADGRWLVEDVTATRDQPPFDASAMDGWAVRSGDIASGAVLDIVGESAAGHALDARIGPGQTARISTGAALPPGADRVVIQEEADRDDGHVVLRASPDGPRHVRARGCDFREGEVLLRTGLRLNPWRIALAASAGRAVLRCGAAPRVAILSTGDELVEPGRPIGPHQIYNSGAPSLSAFVSRHAGAAYGLPTAADDAQAIARTIAGAAFDLLVTVGGASVGDHDLVKPAVRGLGGMLAVEGVAMRPGKPVWFARLPDGRPVLGLPGNPASALVGAELFLAPILAALQGAQAEDRFETAVLGQALPANGPRDHYIRAEAAPGPDGARVVRPFADQDSSLVTVMAAANALIRRRPHAPAAEVGEVVEVLGPTL